MSLAMMGVRYKSDSRDKFLQHGNWVLKLGLWLLFSALPFFLPSSVVYGYGGRLRCRNTCAASVPLLPLPMMLLLLLPADWLAGWQLGAPAAE
jgi:hypothetical protein